MLADVSTGVVESNPESSLEIPASSNIRLAYPEGYLEFQCGEFFKSRYELKDSNVGLTPKVRRALMLVLGDSMMVLLSTIVGFLCAASARSVMFDVDTPLDGVLQTQLVLMYVVAGSLTLWFSWSWGHYTRFRPVWTEYRDIVKISVNAGLAGIMILFALKLQLSRLWIGFFVLSMLAFLPVGRYSCRLVMAKLGWWYKSTYVVGTGDNALMTAAALESDKAMGHRVDGFISLDGTSSSHDNDI